MGIGRRAHLKRIAWRRTHADYRSELDGVRSILVGRDSATLLCPIAQLTDAEVERLAGVER